MENKFLVKLEKEICQEIKHVLTNHCGSDLLIRLDGVEFDGAVSYCDSKLIDVTLLDNLYHGVDNEYSVIKANLSKLLEIKESHNGKLLSGIYVLHGNDIVDFISDGEFFNYNDCENSKTFNDMINQVYNKITDENNIENCLRLISISDRKDKEDHMQISNLLQALQKVRQLMETEK